MRRREFLFGAAAALAGSGQAAIDRRKLAPTPPMGWMSWNLFGPEVSEQLLRETAEAMISSGMKKAGFQYLCIDDLWQGGRDREGNLYPDEKRFPNGMKAVADFAHSKGFKLGIYSDAAEKTCAEQPGSYGREGTDARTFASWGIDYLKYDYCFAPEDQATAIQRYGRMAQSLDAAGRPVVFSICEWGPREPWLWGAKVGGNLWRTTWDIRDIWQGEYNDSHLGVMDIIDHQAGLEKYAGPGGWNDPDMLIVGLYGKGMYTSPKGWAACNDTEYRSQMSLWCLMASPLLATCDLRNMNQATREILTNTEVVAINQDKLGKQAARVVKDGELEVWKKPLSRGESALGLLNRGAGTAAMRVKWADIELKGKCAVRDLWAKKDLGAFDGEITMDVASHETKLLRVKPAG